MDANKIEFMSRGHGISIRLLNIKILYSLLININLYTEFLAVYQPKFTLQRPQASRNKSNKAMFFYRA